jgi:putative ABC transport system permease protein
MPASSAKDAGLIGKGGKAMLGELWQDGRFAARTFGRTPLQLAAAIVALGLGTAAVIAVFSVVDAVLLRPLDFEEPERLVTIWESQPDKGDDQVRVSVPNFFDWRSQNGVFEKMTASYSWKSTLTGLESPERLWVGYVSADFFETLRVEPVLGRTILPEDDRPDSEKVIVLSHGFWQTRFSQDPEVLGRRIGVDDLQYTVVGVMKAGFDYPKDTMVWMPLGYDADTYPRSFHFLEVIGRLAPGVTLAQARVKMEAIGRRLEEEHADTNAGWKVSLIPMEQLRADKSRPALHLLAGAVVLVLMIACANVAGLTLARSSARRDELALRSALGAGPARLIRQSLTESGLLALAGGAAGLLLAFFVVRFVAGVGPKVLPRLAAVTIDLRALLFALVISLLAGLTVGCLPALRASRLSLERWLKAVGSAKTASGQRALDLLTVAETGLALMLLIAAGLLIRSFQSLVSVDTGIDGKGVVALELELPAARYPEGHQPAAFFQEVLERIDALPGVSSAGAVFSLPMVRESLKVGYTVDGRQDAGEEQAHTAVIWPITLGYLETLGIELRQGRGFTRFDGPGAPPVVLISESLARQHWPDKDPIGQRLVLGANFGETGKLVRASREIVGMVADVRHRGPGSEPEPGIYFPHAQSDWRTMSLAVQSAPDVDPLALVPAIRDQVRALDAGLAIANVRTMDQIVTESTYRSSFMALLLSTLAGLALVLAAMGVYSVSSFSVTQRRREIAVRMALGADRGAVLRQVLGRATVLAALGAVLGVIASWAFAGWLSSLLFGVGRSDPLTLVVVTSVLIAAACLASFLPARWASRIDPATVLRVE